MKPRGALYARPVIVREGGNAPWVPLTPRSQLATGDAEAFGARRTACSLSASCQHTFLATPCAAGRRLDPSPRTSWEDMVRSMALNSSVWEPHSLHCRGHTQRAGSAPRSRSRRCDSPHDRAQPAIARVGQYPKPHPPALRGVREARWGSNTRYCAPPLHFRGSLCSTGHNASAALPLRGSL